VKLRLPDDVVATLENTADALGVSLETLVLEIITSRRAAGGNSRSAG
jgi:predicted HicB family RNase H-like nuclease